MTQDIEKLANLKQQGIVLSEEEFQQTKRRILTLEYLGYHSYPI